MRSESAVSSRREKQLWVAKTNQRRGLRWVAGCSTFPLVRRRKPKDRHRPGSSPEPDHRETGCRAVKGNRTRQPTASVVGTDLEEEPRLREITGGSPQGESPPDAASVAAGRHGGLRPVRAGSHRSRRSRPAAKGEPHRVEPGNWRDPDRSDIVASKENPERARLRSSFLGVFRVRGTRYQVPSTKYQVPGTKYQEDQRIGNARSQVPSFLEGGRASLRARRVKARAARIGSWPHPPASSLRSSAVPIERGTDLPVVLRTS